MASPVKRRIPAHPSRTAVQSSTVLGAGSVGIGIADATRSGTPTGGDTFDQVKAAAAKPCVLTWYDPALGGTNSSHGQHDPHARTASGEPYDPGKDTCAAPRAYKFGTIITFLYAGETVVCKVNDRGGAIVGNHFDLSRHAAETLGIIGAGKVNAKFYVGGGALHDPLSDAASLLAGQRSLGDLGLPDPMAVFKELAKMFMALFYPGTWVRIGKVVGGFLLLMWGVHALLKASFGIDVVRGAKKVAGKAALAATIK